ncbi:hypothetical protein D3C75_819940 [compost metagenome]
MLFQRRVSKPDKSGQSLEQPEVDLLAKELYPAYIPSDLIHSDRLALCAYGAPDQSLNF